jgi:hypothetical protein
MKMQAMIVRSESTYTYLHTVAHDDFSFQKVDQRRWCRLGNNVICKKKARKRGILNRK